EQLKLFADSTPIEGRIALGHGKTNSPRFEFIEDGFGAVAHELGHALGLPHDRRRDDKDVMGNGFRNFRFNLDGSTPADKRIGFSSENARMLITSRFLGVDLNLDDNSSPKVEATLP